MFFADAIEDTYDDAMKGYYESDERAMLNSIAEDKYTHLLSRLSDDQKEALTDFRQAMIDLMASESCNAYVTGVHIGLREK